MTVNSKDTNLNVTVITMCLICVTKAANEQNLLLQGEKDAYITKTEATVRDSEQEIQQLRNTIVRFVLHPRF